MTDYIMTTHCSHYSYIFHCIFIQIMNQSVVSAPTVERAATLLDFALFSRSGNRPGISSHMFFTLHVHQQHAQGPTKDISEYYCSLARSLARPPWHLTVCDPKGFSGMSRKETPSSFLQSPMMKGCFHIPLILPCI